MIDHANSSLLPNVENAHSAEPSSELRPPANNLDSTQNDMGFEIRIPRDLAVQLIGSDAGKEKRIKPQSHMTLFTTPDDLAAVEQVMRPFLESEIRRRHEDKSHHLMEFVTKVTSHQARAVKKFCLPYAAHLKQHLAKHPGDERYQRSQHRLGQIHFVIAQINAALGTLYDDGRTIDECICDIETGRLQLLRLLDELIGRVNASGSTPDRAAVLMRLRGPLIAAAQ